MSLKSKEGIDELKACCDLAWTPSGFEKLSKVSHVRSSRLQLHSMILVSPLLLLSLSIHSPRLLRWQSCYVLLELPKLPSSPVSSSNHSSSLWTVWGLWMAILAIQNFTSVWEGGGGRFHIYKENGRSCKRVEYSCWNGICSGNRRLHEHSSHIDIRI